MLSPKEMIAMATTRTPDQAQVTCYMTVNKLRELLDDLCDPDGNLNLGVPGASRLIVYAGDPSFCTYLAKIEFGDEKLI